MMRSVNVLFLHHPGNLAAAKYGHCCVLAQAFPDDGVMMHL